MTLGEYRYRVVLRVDDSNESVRDSGLVRVNVYRLVLLSGTMRLCTQEYSPTPGLTVIVFNPSSDSSYLVTKWVMSTLSFLIMPTSLNVLSTLKSDILISFVAAAGLEPATPRSGREPSPVALTN